MNKAVPWRIKGVPFDARAAAIEAARRSGLSLGEWLNTVIAEQAAADGKHEEEFDLDAKLDAVTARLATLRDRTSSDRDAIAGPTRRRVEPVRDRRPPVRDKMFESDARYVDHGHDDDHDHDRHDDHDGDAIPEARSSRDRSSRRDAPPRKDIAAEGLLENAIAAFDRRANRSSERTARALAQVADLIDTGHRGRERDDVALATIADRLNDIERRVAQPVATPTPDPHVRDVLVRLEQRIEGLATQPAAARIAVAARPVVPAAPRPVPAPAPVADPHVHEALARLERRLDTMAQREAARREAEVSHRPAPSIDEASRSEPPPATRREARQDFRQDQRQDSRQDSKQDSRSSVKRPLAAAIAEVARRQKELDDPFTAPDVPMRRVRPPEAVPSALETRLSTLIDRLERTTVRPADAGSGPDISGLQGNIDTLADRIETMRTEIAARQSASAPRGDGGIADMRREIAAMSRAVSNLAPRNTVTALETSIRDLSARVAESRMGGVGEAALAPVEGLVRELLAVVRNSATTPSIATLDRSIRSVAAKLEAFDGTAVADHDLARGIAEQTREIRDTLARILENQVPADRIEQGIAELATRVERIAIGGIDPLGRGEMAKSVSEIRSLLGDPAAENGALKMLERRLDTIAERVDAVFGARLDSMLAAQCDARNNAPDVDTLMADLGARIDRAVSGGLAAMESNVARLMETGRADTPSSHLETMVRDLATRLDATSASDASADALEAMNKQIAHLAKHFDRNDKTAETLVALQESVGDLFTRLDESQTAALDAAQSAARAVALDAVRDVADGSSELTREFSDLRALQDAADHRTHSTLTAVHDTLAKVVDRLSSLEDDFADVRATTRRPGASRAPGGRPEQARPRMPATGDRRATAVPPRDEADILIEPGLAFDRRRAVAESELSDPAAAPASDLASELSPGLSDVRPQASFIQAARRAAKAAGAIDTAPPSERTLAANTARAAPVDQVRAYYASRKRPILLGLAALMVVAGAFQVAKIATGEHGAPTPSATMQPTAPSLDVPRGKTDKPTPSGTAPENKPAAAAPEIAPSPGRRADAAPSSIEPASPAIDRLPVGAIARPEQTSDSNGAVRALAIAGDPSAQYELGVRYADGKLLARDQKLSQQWFEKAAAKGVAPAQYRLGAMYERGVGVTKDAALAKQWYMRAADGGNARAMHNLAVLYADGSGGKPDYAEAITWFRHAAELGVRDSQFNLAILYARGMGTAPNMVDSYIWFAAAAAQGDEDAGRKRDDVAARLPQNDLARAKALFAAFKPKPTDPAANEVLPPPGGWDAAARQAQSDKPQAQPDGKPVQPEAKPGRPKVSRL